MHLIFSFCVFFLSLVLFLVAQQTAKICSFETFFTYLCGKYIFFENGKAGTKEPENGRIVLEFKQWQWRYYRKIQLTMALSAKISHQFTDMLKSLLFFFFFCCCRISWPFCHVVWKIWAASFHISTISKLKFKSQQRQTKIRSHLFHGNFWAWINSIASFRPAARNFYTKRK